MAVVTHVQSKTCAMASAECRAGGQALPTQSPALRGGPAATMVMTCAGSIPEQWVLCKTRRSR